MKKCFLALSLLAFQAHADDDLDSYLEVGKYWKTNKGGYIDGSGPHKAYSLDFETRKHFFDRHFNIMFGLDTDTNGHQFSRAAGRFGAEARIDIFDIGVWHRSDHNFDHSTGPFFSENRFYIRWNISGRGRP